MLASAHAAYVLRRKQRGPIAPSAESEQRSGRFSLKLTDIVSCASAAIRIRIRPKWRATIVCQYSVSASHGAVIPGRHRNAVILCLFTPLFNPARYDRTGWMVAEKSILPVAKDHFRAAMNFQDKSAQRGRKRLHHDSHKIKARAKTSIFFVLAKVYLRTWGAACLDIGPEHWFFFAPSPDYFSKDGPPSCRGVVWESHKKSFPSRVVGDNAVPSRPSKEVRSRGTIDTSRGKGPLEAWDGRCREFALGNSLGSKLAPCCPGSVADKALLYTLQTSCVRFGQYHRQAASQHRAAKNIRTIQISGRESINLLGAHVVIVIRTKRRVRAYFCRQPRSKLQLVGVP